MASYAGSRDYTDSPAGAGWVVFAATMLGLAGTWNIIDGILAIGSSKIYAANATYVFSDLNTWGWIVMVLGITQLLAAFAVVGGSEGARWFGIAVAGVNSLAQLAFIPAYPWWSLAMFTVDILIIYGLAVYGGAKLRQT